MKIPLANSSLAAWLTKAVSALRNRNRVQLTDTVLPMQNVSQITPGWDYRPRGIVRQDAAFDCGRVETAEVAGSSMSKENDDVWFNFTNAEPAVEQPPTAAVSRDGRQVSMYDQSPIDNRDITTE